MDSFKYANLEEKASQAGGSVRDGKHFAFSNRNFHQLIPADFNEEELSGWKLHVSVANENVANSWDTLLPVFEKHDLAAKVATPQTAKNFSSPESPQKGKMITVYFTYQKEHASIVEEIEETLGKSGIDKGEAVLGDRQVEGSNYIFYRNDRSADGQYIGADSAKSKGLEHNPENASDPLKDVVVGTPENRLNMFAEQAGLSGRFTHDAGKGGAGRPNKRISLPLDEARRTHEALEEQGIPAQIGRKGEQYLVVVPDNEQSDNVPFENYQKAIQHHQALRIQEVFNSREEAPRWYVDPGRGASGSPNLRTECASPQEAVGLAEDMSLSGINAQHVTKGKTDLVRIFPEDFPEVGHDPHQRGALAPNRQAPDRQSSGIER